MKPCTGGQSAAAPGGGRAGGALRHASWRPGRAGAWGQAGASRGRRTRAAEKFQELRPSAFKNSYN